MSLTIPRAGLDAGRAANMAGMAPEVDPTAAAFAKLGEVVAERGRAIQDENDAMVLNRLNIEMARDMGRAQLELSQSNDPNVDGLWAAKAAEIRAKHVDRVPEMNAGLRERAALVFGDMEARHSLAVGKQAIATRSSYRAAQWIEQSGTIAAEAATAPQETLEDMLAAGENAISLRLAAGDITPEQAATERVKFRSDVMTSRANAEIARDPDAFLANSDQYKELGTGQADLILSAEAASTARREKSAKEQEVAVKEQRAAIDAELKEGLALMKTGDLWSGEAELSNPVVQASPLYPELMAAKSLRDDKIILGQKSPPELQALIDAEAGKPKGRAWEAERQKVLREALQATKTAWATNAVDAARAAGIIAQDDVLTFDPANPQAFAAGLTKRFDLDDWQREKQYAPNGQAIVGTDELAQIKPIMAPDADAADKAAMLGAFAAQNRPAAQVDAALAMVGGGDVERRAVRLLRETGDQGLVETMLRGQQQVKLGNIKMPAESDRILAFSEATDGIFDDSPRLRAQYMAAADALYAADAIKINPDGASFKDVGDAKDVFSAAVQRVTGVAVDRNGQPAIGGLQDVNGAKVVLPQGVHRTEVEEAIENIGAQLSGMQFNALAGTWVRPELYAPFTESPNDRQGDGMVEGGQPSAEQVLQSEGQLSDTRQVWGGVEKGWITPDPADNMVGSIRKPVTAAAAQQEKMAGVNATIKPALDPLRAFKAASVTGDLAPDLGPYPSRTLADIQVRQAFDPRTNEPNGMYELVRMVNGRAQVVTIAGDDAGRPYQFSMSDLIAGAQQ